MAILKVAQMGHPVLRRVAEEVPPEIIPTEAFQQFCDDLLDTMVEYEGAGLAAPQVHESVRVCVLTLDDEREPEFFVNPQITVLSDETMRYYEGCLSVTDLRGAVERPSHIKVEALDRYGRTKAYELRGFSAIVVQHECDHLDGILFIDKVDTSTLAFLSEYRRFGPLDRFVDGDLEDGEEWTDEEAEAEPLDEEST